MKTKYIIAMIIALAGLCLFGYPLIRYWYAGTDIFVIIGTFVGIPMIGAGTWLRRLMEKKKEAAFKSGQRHPYGWPLFETFVFFIALFITTMLFTSLPVHFFLSFVFATMAGGFGWWFFQTWIITRSPDMTKQ